MIGLPVYDFITRQQFDTETGDTYDAMCSCNDATMAERCHDPNANKCVWTIKAYAQENSEMATALRAGIQTGNLSLLISEYDAEQVIKKVPGYGSMTTEEKVKLLMPYAQTTALVNEMVNLEGKIMDNKVKLKEHSGMRKDRFSSLEYNYYIAQTIGRELNRKNSGTTKSLLDLLSGSMRKSSIIK